MKGLAPFFSKPLLANFCNYFSLFIDFYLFVKSWLLVKGRILRVYSLAYRECVCKSKNCFVMSALIFLFILTSFCYCNSFLSYIHVYAGVSILYVQLLFCLKMSMFFFYKSGCFLSKQRLLLVIFLSTKTYYFVPSWIS